MVMMSEKEVDRYLRHATEDMYKNDKDEIRCPCRNCKLMTLHRPFSGVVRDHLLMRGFMDGGATLSWMNDEDDNVEVHAAEPTVEDDDEGDHDMMIVENNNEGREDEEPTTAHDNGELVNYMGPTPTPLTTYLKDPHLQELLLRPTSNDRAAAREKSKLGQLQIDSDTPLYPGCRPEDSRLKVALDVLQMKTKHQWTDVSIDENLQYWKNVLPENNTLPTSLNDAKKVVCPLDLPHERYHVCINDCYIYRNEDTDKTTCPVCNAARYKIAKKAPHKVVWYFPLIPRLQRFFADRTEAKRMCWHAERRAAMLKDLEHSEKIILTYPSDASKWKAVDTYDPEFGDEPRNIRLAVSTDGLNPFGN